MVMFSEPDKSFVLSSSDLTGDSSRECLCLHGADAKLRSTELRYVEVNSLLSFPPVQTTEVSQQQCHH